MGPRLGWMLVNGIRGTVATALGSVWETTFEVGNVAVVDGGKPNNCAGLTAVKGSNRLGADDALAIEDGFTW